MTLVETIVAVALLVVCGIGGMYAFMVLNRYAAQERDLSAAKALCQERIEQVLTMTFRPATTTTAAPSLPAVIGQNQDPTVTYSILGTQPNYTTTGIYTGAESTTELVTIYTQQGDTTGTVATTNSNGGVTGTRTTTVAPSSLMDMNSPLVPLGVVQFTVTVAYIFHGQSYSYTMTTMRSPDT